MITGSHHQQVYWYATGRNRLLGQLPGAYLIAEQRWIPRRVGRAPPARRSARSRKPATGTAPASRATPRTGSRSSTRRLASQPIETQTVDTTVAELGIACEACHGPSGAARAHQSESAAPVRAAPRPVPPDSTTVQPARLCRALSSQACGQCHGIWEFYDRAGERQANSARAALSAGRRADEDALRRAADRERAKRRP